MTGRVCIFLWFLMLFMPPMVLADEIKPDPLPYFVTVERVMDGDTFMVKSDFCFPVAWCQAKVRVFGIDTPETSMRVRGAKCTKEQKLGFIAKSWAINLLTNQKVTVRLLPKNLQDDPYGRLLGTVTLGNGKDYAFEAIRLGHARPFLKDKDGRLIKSNWCDGEVPL